MVYVKDVDDKSFEATLKNECFMKAFFLLNLRHKGYGKIVFTDS